MLFIIKSYQFNISNTLHDIKQVIKNIKKQPFKYILETQVSLWSQKPVHTKWQVYRFDFKSLTTKHVPITIISPEYIHTCM